MSKHLLKEITSKIGSGATPTGGKGAYKGGDYSLIRSQNVLDMSFLREGLVYINDEQAKKLDGVKVESGDVLFNITGDSICRCCIVPDDILPARVNQHVAIIRPKSVNSAYLMYYLQYLKPYLMSICGNGSSRNALTKDSLEKLEIEISPFSNSIAEILSSLDKKIINNKRITSELESFAKTIYDYWFLQFEFPNEEGKPYKSSGGKMVWCEELKREIPDGWEVSTLKNMYEIKRGISYSSKDIESGEGIPMINLACIDINRNYRDGELKYYNRKNAPILDEGDMLIATTDLTRNADIVGCPIITPYDGNKYTYSMDLARIDINCPTLSKWYVYSTLRTESYHNYIKKWASGTNVLHLNLDGMNWYTILIPDIAVQKTYAGIIEPIVKKQSLLIKENRELSSLRDFLLPMLMNGQVTFKDN